MYTDKARPDVYIDGGSGTGFTEAVISVVWGSVAATRFWSSCSPMLRFVDRHVVGDPCSGIRESDGLVVESDGFLGAAIASEAVAGQVSPLSVLDMVKGEDIEHCPATESDQGH